LLVVSAYYADEKSYEGKRQSVYRHDIVTGFYCKISNFSIL